MALVARELRNTVWKCLLNCCRNLQSHISLCGLLTLLLLLRNDWPTVCVADAARRYWIEVEFRVRLTSGSTRQWRAAMAKPPCDLRHVGWSQLGLRQRVTTPRAESDTICIDQRLAAAGAKFRAPNVENCDENHNRNYQEEFHRWKADPSQETHKRHISKRVAPSQDPLFCWNVLVELEKEKAANGKSAPTRHKYEKAYDVLVHIGHDRHFQFAQRNGWLTPPRTEQRIVGLPIHSTGPPRLVPEGRRARQGLCVLAMLAATCSTWSIVLDGGEPCGNGLLLFGPALFAGDHLKVPYP